MQLGAEARSPNILLQINLLFTFIKANSSTLLIIATARDSFIVRAGRNLESSGPTPIRGLSSLQHFPPSFTPPSCLWGAFYIQQH